MFPLLFFVSTSVLERREHDIDNARRFLKRLVENFAAQQELETRRLQTVLETLAGDAAVRSMDLPACEVLFKHVLAGNPHYVNFALLDSKGEAVASALSFTRQNLSNRKEVAQVLGGASFAVGEYSIGRVSGEQILPFAHAVKDQSGQTIGVLLATQRLQATLSLFVLSALPQGSFFGLADHKGIRLFRQPPSESSPVGVPIAPRIWESIRTTPELGFITESGSDGVVRELSVRKVALREGESPYLYVFAGIPRAAVVSAADVLARRTALLLAASLALASVLAYFVARYGIHDPVTKVIDASKRIGRGDLSARTGLGKIGGSIGELLGAIDDMAASLERDRAARDAAEQDSARQRMLLHSVIEGASDAIFIKDTSGRYLMANTEVARVTGRPVEEIIGYDDTHLFPAAEAEAIMLNDRLVMSSGNACKFQEILHTTAGTLVYLTAKGPLYDDTGELIGMFGVSRDITEQIKVQELLVQTEKMMSVGGLAAGLAHEINNPLSGILQNVQVLQRRMTSDLPANEEAARQVGCSFGAIRKFMEDRGILTGIGSIREAGSRAASIVSSMLEFSRQGSLRFEPASLTELLDKAVDLCSTDFDLKKRYDFKLINIVREYEGGLPAIPCLGTQIQQVFMNLMTNAAHAMKGAASSTLILRAAREDDVIRVEIEDTGPGMDEKVRKKIFEPFFTTKPVGEGTGLGLSVSFFIIVSHHHGSIEVESEPGHGAKFTIRLPVSQPLDESGLGTRT